MIFGDLFVGNKLWGCQYFCFALHLVMCFLLIYLHFICIKKYRTAYINMLMKNKS